MDFADLFLVERVVDFELLSLLARDELIRYELDHRPVIGHDDALTSLLMNSLVSRALALEWVPL